MPIKQITMPADRTEGLRNAVQMALNALLRGEHAEAVHQLEDLVQDIGRAYVCKEREEVSRCSVPDYDPKVDGDYTSFLVANNCD
jgi:HEPN domain-containing protein